jgi:hypothetical protein
MVGTLAVRQIKYLKNSEEETESNVKKKNVQAVDKLGIRKYTVEV